MKAMFGDPRLLGATLNLSQEVLTETLGYYLPCTRQVYQDFTGSCHMATRYYRCQLCEREI